MTPLLLATFSDLLSFANRHLAVVSGITGSLMLILPQGRRVLRALWAWLSKGRKMQETILQKVTNIETEIQFSNDTSTKQEVALLKNRQHLDFWRATRPSLELDGDAQVLHVSETLCRLLGVVTPADLYLRNWLRFVEPGRVDDFLMAYAENVKYKSAVNFHFALHASRDGESRGQWELMLSPVSPAGYSKPIYSGFFRPVDEVAKEAAKSLHWIR